MRVVVDTNIIVSGLLWQGPSRQILELARQRKIELFTTPPLVAELEEVLNREKFLKRLQQAQVEASELITGFMALATVIRPAQISSVVLRDPDDDAVIACAVAAKAVVIISGDQDLLDLKQHQEIRIIKAVQFLEESELDGADS